MTLKSNPFNRSLWTHWNKKLFGPKSLKFQRSNLDRLAKHPDCNCISLYRNWVQKSDFLTWFKFFRPKSWLNSSLYKANIRSSNLLSILIYGLKVQGILHGTLLQYVCHMKFYLCPTYPMKPTPAASNTSFTCTSKWLSAVLLSRLFYWMSKEILKSVETLNLLG